MVKKHRELVKLNNYFIGLIILWVSILIVSTAWNIYSIEKKQNKMALEHAKNAFQKDLMFRKWIASHGGVYVFPTKKTPPNPYLAHIENRDLEAKTGEKLTLMNPAYALRELMNNFPGMYGERGHITSLKLLNPNNKADEWEEKTLNYFQKNREDKDYYEFYDYDGEPHLRYMHSLTIKQECLKCHAHQGYKVGDLRGGVSITVPMEKYLSDSDSEKSTNLLVHFVLLVMGLIVLYILYNKLKSRTMEQIKIEEELRLKEDLLLQQSKMAQMGEMIGNIAHQWRQPLSVISSVSTGLQMNIEFDNFNKEQAIKDLEGLNKSAQFLSRTIDDFRNFFKSTNKKEEFILTEICDEIDTIIGASYKNHDITVIRNIGDINLNTFKGELTQVILNIFNNAKDALLAHQQENRYIFVNAETKNNEFILRIKDNAGGVPDDIIDKIFDPYFTTKHQSQGTGLGLYMSFEIIFAHMNGSISVQNKEYEYNDTMYKGAEFTISIPMI